LIPFHRTIRQAPVGDRDHIGRLAIDKVCWDLHEFPVDMPFGLARKSGIWASIWLINVPNSSWVSYPIAWIFQFTTGISQLTTS
jgi:hypothetical protein